MVDGIVVVGMIVAIALGFKDGFFRKLYSTLGFIVGLFAAILFVDSGGEFIENMMGLSVPIARIVAFAIVFVITIVLTNVLYRVMGSGKGETVKVWSRFVGGFIGSFQGAISVSLILLFMHRTGWINEQDIQSSYLYDTFVNVAPQVLDYSMRWLPQAGQFIDEIKGRL